MKLHLIMITDENGEDTVFTNTKTAFINLHEVLIALPQDEKDYDSPTNLIMKTHDIFRVEETYTEMCEVLKTLFYPVPIE